MFDATLVNRTFGDPGVLIDLKFERRAILFDIGDISALPTRKLLRAVGKLTAGSFRVSGTGES